MSTKTTFKRIALVAVAALTLGSFSAVSASAHQADTLTASATASTTTAGTAVSVILNQSFVATANSDGMAITASLISAPATSVALPVLSVAGGTNVNATTTLTGTLVSTSVATAGAPTYTTGYTTATLTPVVAGTYVIKFTPSVTAGGGTLQSAAVTWTVTVGSTLVVTAANSTSFLNSGETTTATADVAVSAIKTASTTVQAATIAVTPLTSAAAAPYVAVALTATISGPGTLGFGGTA